MHRTTGPNRERVDVVAPVIAAAITALFLTVMEQKAGIRLNPYSMPSITVFILATAAAAWVRRPRA